MTRLALDLVQQKDFNGNPITLGGEAVNLLMPLPANAYQELNNDPKGANLLLSMIADAMGISTNTYGSTKPKLQTFLGKTEVDPKIVTEMDRLSVSGNAPAIGTIESSTYAQKLKEQVSPDQYKKFVQDFQTNMESKMVQRIESPFYKNMTVENKSKSLEDLKANVLQMSLRKYGYKEPNKNVAPKQY